MYSIACCAVSNVLRFCLFSWNMPLCYKFRFQEPSKSELKLTVPSKLKVCIDYSPHLPQLLKTFEDFLFNEDDKPN